MYIISCAVYSKQLDQVFSSSAVRHTLKEALEFVQSDYEEEARKRKLPMMTPKELRDLETNWSFKSPKCPEWENERNSWAIRLV